MERRVQESDFFKVEQVVEKVLKKRNQQAILYFSKIFRNWDIIVGAPLAQKTAPQKLTARTLYIMVEDAAYAHHLKYFTKNIIELIASPEICGEGVVKKIVFRVGPKSIMRQNTAKKKSTLQKPLPIAYKILPHAQKTAKSINDSKLQRLFASFMSKTISRKSSSS